MKLRFEKPIGYVFDEWFFIALARLGLTGAKTQVSVGWKEICAVVERSLYWGSNALSLRHQMVPKNRDTIIFLTLLLFFNYLNRICSGARMRLIGNPVKFGDGPAAVTPPFLFYTTRGIFSMVAHHCPNLSGWEGR